MDSEERINPDKGNRVAVFASGGGSNFEVLAEARAEGKLDVEFSLLVSNNSGCGAAGKAEKRGIPFVHLSDSHFKSIGEYERKLISCLTDYRIDIIVLAGYMKKIPGCVVRSFKNRILNIHPALLP
ncbi:MAG: formyltransferase family protein, partial [Chitinivibrionales bacterium]